MTTSLQPWPYVPTLSRLVLALALGLLIGIERERRRKEAGLRTFAFAALVGAVGGLLGDAFALLALGLLGVLVVLLNIETIRTGEGAEITTSAALLVTGFMGVLAGQGHSFTPTALGVAVAALLAWKEPLAGFSQALTDAELRSAILLAILAFIVYPVLPSGSVDPWHLIDPRGAWVTVILIAALGFVNYVLLKLYGARGILLGSFLGGLVNSTVTVTDLARRVQSEGGRFIELAFRGVTLATGAMLLRNAVLLALLAPSAAGAAALPLAFMMGAVFVIALRGRGDARAEAEDATAVAAHLRSPFSLQSALKFGLIFLALQVAGTLAERALGEGGFYAVSTVGGLVSSASAVASAGNLAAAGTIGAKVAAVGALVASLASAAINLPILARVARHPGLTRRFAAVLGTALLVGALGFGAVLLLERL